MPLLMTAVFANGFQEIYLPAVDNKTVPIDIRPHISGLKTDLTLPLEVWEGAWSLSASRQYRLLKGEQSLEKIELSPGLLLNGALRGSDELFSLTIDEIGEGNTRFDKYLFDAKALPQLTIGSANTNAVRYENRFCSPTHARIDADAAGATLRDMGSVNGTFVNGRLLTEPFPLRYGDVIYIIGLKIVYLGNVLAINNPGGKCRVDKLRPVRIQAPEPVEDEEMPDVAETYFLRTPRKLERLNDDAFAIEKCPAKSVQKRQPMLLSIGPSFTMMIPMIAGMSMMGEGGNIASSLVMSVGAAVLSGAWALISIRYQRGEDAAAEAQRVAGYTAYIARVAERVKQRIEVNRAVLERMLPSGAEVVQFAGYGNARLWEKESTHEDFLTVRFGLGDIPSPNAIEVPKEQLMAEHDPLNDKVEEIRETMSTLRSVPVSISAWDNRCVGLVGRDRQRALNLGNLVSTQLAGLHPYTDVRLCVVYPMREADAWDYARWMPHVWTPDGKLRMLCSDKNTVGDVMFHLSSVIRDRLEGGETRDENEKALPHYVVIVADWSLIEDEPIAKYLQNPPREIGFSVVSIADSVDRLPSGCTAIVQDDDDERALFSTVGAFPRRENVQFDRVTPEQAENFARSLSNYRLRDTGASAAIPDTVTFLDMYRLSRVEDLDMLHKWLDNRTYESMRAMIGIRSGNQPLYLDIHEKYHGPHGLVAGTTGSGKSETLQSYILSLAIHYHPHEVAFILIDYKGGGMAQSFLGLPHLSGVITNLGGNATDRALLSINAEIKGRQRLFNEYRVKHIDAYIELYRSGVATEPMPHLLIIADEFAELKKEQPEFVRSLVSAARVGRSLGVNLILATQKPSGVVDDEIWSNTRFRLCLRVADKSDSNEMLKRPDAAFITGVGRGFFQVGNDEIFDEFQSGWSGAEYEPDVPFADDKSAKVELINLIGKSGVPKQKKKRKSDNALKVTQLDAIVKHAAQVAREAGIAPLKPIWLPPLPKAVYLDALDVPTPEGFSLLLPLGLVDSPETQSQYACAIDVVRDGNVLVCGSGGSGRTTLLQTLIYGAVTRYAPRDINLYIADFSSRTMTAFANCPHVGAVLFEGEDERIAETIDLLQATLARRKAEFSQEGIGSYREYRQQHDDCPAIVLVIDNYVAFMESYDIHEDAIAQLSREAPSYGIYLILTMNNAGELRSRIRQNFLTGVALQMPDRYEYEAVIGQRSEILPEDRTPGRGLIKAPNAAEFQTALCVREEEGLSIAQTLRRRFADVSREGAIRRIGERAAGLTIDELLAREDVRALPEPRYALGLSMEERALVTVDMDGEFLYTVGGNPGSGRSTLLWTLARQARDKGARVLLYAGPDTRPPDDIAFERVARGDEQLFALLEEVLVPAFSERNERVSAARDRGRDPIAELAETPRIVLLIDDIDDFLRAAYSEDMDMNEFLEIAFERGAQHRIAIVAAVSPDEAYDAMRYAAFRTFAQAARGVHLGGFVDQQSILSFALSAADGVRQLPPGVGYADVGGKTVTFQAPKWKGER